MAPLWHTPSALANDAPGDAYRQRESILGAVPARVARLRASRPEGPSRLLVSRVETCATPGCSCCNIGLRAVTLEADDSFDPTTLTTDEFHTRFATDAMNAQLDIDTGAVAADDAAGRAPLSTDWIEYLASHIDGELLDALHAKWLLTKGMKSAPTSDWERRDPGILVGWYEAHPGDRLDVYLDEAGAFLAEDLFCVNPTCACSEVVVAFSPANVPSASDVGAIRVRVPDLEVLGRQSKPEAAALLDRLWRAFSARHRTLAARLSERRKQMVELAAEHSRRARPQAHAAARVGRNEPCPCGSGKKYKRCCG